MMCGSFFGSKRKEEFLPFYVDRISVLVHLLNHQEKVANGILNQRKGIFF